MTAKHPYVSSSGPLIQTIEHLRNSFPTTLNAETLKKLGIASGNESFILNILRFINVVDGDGTKTEAATSIFSQHDDPSFQEALAKQIRTSYDDLFQLHGDGAWSLDTNRLIQFFRSSDHTSAVVGRRQANTFQALAGVAGKAEPPSVRTTNSSSKKSPRNRNPRTRNAKGTTTANVQNHISDPGSRSSFGLTVRVEVNLPADADQETYDYIFASIRKNLINGD